MPRRARRRALPGDARGQATVELVALLPLLVLLIAALWQAVVAGQALWLSGAAARAAARAAAVGHDPAAAARRVLPAALERGLRVRDRRGAVTVAVPVRAVLGGARLTTVGASARFVAQS